MIQRRKVADSTVAALLLSCAALCSACNKGDPKKCTQAMDVTKQSLKVQNVALARQWRDYAWKECDDKTALQALDKEVIAGQNAITKKKQEQDLKKTQSQELMGLFVQWAGEHRAAPDTAAASVICEAADKPAKGAPPPKKTDKPHRFCTRTRNVSGSFSFQVRYREDDVSSVHFSTIAPAPVTCAALGANKVLRRWPNRTECEITGGRLQGLDALISQAADGTHVEVFSPQYLKRDAALKSELR